MISKGATHVPVLDLEGALARFDGDKQLFVEMADILLEDAPRLVMDLRSAVAANDATAVEAHAHALKGLLAGCGGVRAARISQSLEKAGKSQMLNDSPAMMESLEDEMAVLTKVLRNYRA
jgi:HPt (histidine-containing phosphotransfer) domain-containing protein